MQTLNLFGLALDSLEWRRIEDALALLEAAERGGHDPNECAGGRWECLMFLGRFRDAWRESTTISANGRPDANALWDGLPFAGKRVVVRTLHGFGDAIQFIRYAQLLKQQAARVIVQTHPELVSLMRAMASIDHTITWDEEDQSLWDQQIEVMELPRAFETTLATIPCAVPYFQIPDGVPRRVPNKTGEMRIGLQWGAGPWNAARSLPLDALDALLHFRPCEYFSFQRGAARQDLRGSRYSHLHDVSGDSPDVIEAAADLLNVDLLITVDTMLAHLAGALGVPVWVLLPFQADWRWMLNRCDSPWYPTMRLFRQSTQGDWTAPVQCAAEALRNWTDGRGQ